MVELDDTQPRSPFKAPPVDDNDTDSSGPGCLVWALIGIVIMGVAVLIIALSAFAGWSSGQRIAQGNGTATQNAVISDQFLRIPTDVSNNNQTLLVKRLDYLTTLTPAVPGLDSIIQTATAMYVNGLPTATPLPSITPTAEAVVEITPEVQQVADSTSSPFDLAGLLKDAQNDVALHDWDNAIKTLDTIISADSTYQTDTVRSLMLQSLTSKALLLFRSGTDSTGLAEANLLTDRAREFGDVSTLEYESLIASQYLDAVNSIGIDFGTAIQKLSGVYAQVPAYKNIKQLLFGQYVAYGDALVASANSCLAAVQYQGALTIFNDPGVNAKMTAAQTACANPPVALTPGSSAIAPVGVGS